jgi:hypothetical protein
MWLAQRAAHEVVISGALHGVGQRSLAEGLHSLVDTYGLGPNVLLQQWPSHRAIAELIVKGCWPSEMVGITLVHAPGRRVKAARPSILVRRDFAEVYRPPREVVQQARKAHRTPLALEVAAEAADADEGVAVPTEVAVPVVARHALFQKGRVTHHFEKWFFIDSVVATFALRSVRDLPVAVARLEQASFGDVARRLQELRSRHGFKWPGPSALTFGRPRLDLACSLYRRHTCKDRLADHISRELMVDASPLMRREVLMIKEMVLTFSGNGENPPDVEERLFPPQTLAYRHMGGPDKVAATLHAVWTEYGQTLGTMEGWARSVRVIATDLGAESAIANVRNILPLFYGITPDACEDIWMFPNALRLPGRSELAIPRGGLESVGVT